MKCVICNLNFSENSGQMLKHIIKEHSLKNVTEYYYLTHESDLCVVCNENNKHIKNWRFEKLQTCDNKICIKILGDKRKGIAAKNLAKLGNCNFQKSNVQEKCKKTRKILQEQGLLYCQSDVGKDKLRKLTIERNLTNNPMKNSITSAKMSKSSTGKILSESHKKNISLGLTNFLDNLTEEEFAQRMKNSAGVIKEVSLELSAVNMNHFLENPQFYVDKTNDLINNMGLTTKFMNDLGIK